MARISRPTPSAAPAPARGVPVPPKPGKARTAAPAAPVLPFADVEAVAAAASVAVALSTVDAAPAALDAVDLSAVTPAALLVDEAHDGDRLRETAAVLAAVLSTVDETDFDPPAFHTGGRLVRAADLRVGDVGRCPPGAVWVPPAGHARHDPRALVARSPEFVADVARRGVQQSVALFLLDGRAEVDDGRGRLAAAADARLDDVPFVVVAPPADALAARLSASRLNALRLAPDPLTRADLAREALDAGLSPEDVAAALGEPLSTVRALVRVATEADDATRALLADGRVDASTALVLVQQTPEVRADIVAAVLDVTAAAEAAPSGAVVDPAVSQKPVATVDRATGRGRATRTFVESKRDEAKGRAPKRGGGDAAAKSAPKSAAPEAPAPEAPARPVADNVAAVRARADAAVARSLLTKPTTEGERAYVKGIRDALEALFDAEFTGGIAHPFPALVAAVLRRAAVRS